MPNYSIGIDFGTESARAVLVDLETGEQRGTASARYASGVIEGRLDAEGRAVSLEPDAALQDPKDYIACLSDVVRTVVAAAEVDMHDVVGLGISFTSCTVLPLDAAGEPLCNEPRFRHAPHAWVKLWKHHSAQAEADDIDRVAARRGEAWIDRYGGRTSCEWYFPKLLEVYRKAPDVYEATHRFVEAGDWIVSVLSGREVASTCTVGYKAGWSAETGFPSADFFAAVAPGFDPSDKLPRNIVPVGGRAGTLSARGATITGLLPGTPVAPVIIDAHASVPGSGVAESGTLVMIMGTSLCHLLLDERAVPVEGIAGAVADGVMPGFVGYEAGQPALGDVLAWATRLTGQPYGTLEAAAAEVAPGAGGLLALDWFNGNRSILDDASLSGAVVGLTLSTTPAELYRALMEAAAFGTKVIVDTFEAAGLRVERCVACGGIAQRSPLLLQIFADVLGRRVAVAAAGETSALGASAYGAIAAGAEAGGYASFAEAVARIVEPPSGVIRPALDHHDVYQKLYAEYRRLHDHFRDEPLMGRLRALRSQGASS